MQFEAPIYTIKNAKLSFGLKALFSDVNLYINRGDKICLVGRNGSGKSTLLKVIAREIAAPSPAVITIGKIGGGFAYNVIPNEVEIEGTTRAFDDGVRQFMAKRIGEISSSVAATFRGSCDYEMDWGAPPVINDAEMAKLAGNAAIRVLGAENVQTSRPSPNMAGEDFAYYLAERPGAFMFLSSSDPAKHTDIPHHNPKFAVDEDVLHQGSAVFVAIVEDFLSA